MKKVALFVAAILTASVGFSQDFKPAGGESNLEVNFAPLGGAPISINNLRYRYFLSGDMAVRVGFSVSSSSSKTTTGGNTVSGDTLDFVTKNSSFGFNIRPGIEKHFAGTDRLSPYIGAEIDFAMFSDKTETDVINSAGDGVVTEVDKNTNGFTRLGVNVVFGTDFYFSQHIYMGAEIGFGFSSTSYKNVEDQTAGANDEIITVETYNTNPNTMNIGPNFNSAIRLGWLF